MFFYICFFLVCVHCTQSYVSDCCWRYISFFVEIFLCCCCCYYLNILVVVHPNCLIRTFYFVIFNILTTTTTTLHPFNGPFSGTTQVSQYQKGKTNLDFTEARDSEWHWHQLGRMQVCTSPQTDNHASTPLLSFLQAGCPSCRPTNSVKALKAYIRLIY